MAADQEPLTLAAFDQAALRYLNRFDASAKKLSDYLLRFARKRGQGAASVRPLIDELIARYRRSGVLDDARFARARIVSLRGRGASSRKIEMKLAAAGVGRDAVRAELGEAPNKKQDDLEAARAYVRRKRLGHHRGAAEQLEEHRKDLARLARQGFDFDTAKRALALGSDDDF